MKTTTRQSIQIERCPYLGLHDDPDTALAYPSCWNYCFHAEPPASILVTHQVDVCLNPKYSSCAVMLANKWERLPRSLQDKSGRRVSRSGPSNRFPWLALLILVVVILLLVIFPGRDLFF